MVTTSAPPWGVMETQFLWSRGWASPVIPFHFHISPGWGYAYEAGMCQKVPGGLSMQSSGF